MLLLWLLLLRRLLLDWSRTCKLLLLSDTAHTLLLLLRLLRLQWLLHLVLRRQALPGLAIHRLLAQTLWRLLLLLLLLLRPVRLLRLLQAGSLLLLLLLEVGWSARLLLLLLRATLLVESDAVHAKVIVAVHVVLSAVLLLLVVVAAQVLIVHARWGGQLIQSNGLRVVRLQLRLVVVREAGGQAAVVSLLAILAVDASGVLVAVRRVLVGLAGLGRLDSLLLLLLLG